MNRNENSKCIWKRNITDKKTFDKGCFYKLGNVSAISKYDCLPVLLYVQYIQNWEGVGEIQGSLFSWYSQLSFQA